MKKYAHRVLFRAFLNLFAEKHKRISANTCTFFPEYSRVFPQIFLRISANKFGTCLKMRFLSVAGIILHLVPVGDMRTSLAGTKACPHRGHSHAPYADMGMSQS